MKRIFLITLAILYGSEAALRIALPRPTKKDVTLKLRAEGLNAVPAVTAQQLLFLEPLKSRTLLPLGGVSRVSTVFCQESGGFHIYTSDRYGFPNPDSLWDSPVDAAIVGDSFAQGACVGPEYSLQALLTQSGQATLSLGSYGNGPLSTLASIREYLVAVKPKVVYWLLVPNDLALDLRLELGHPLLHKYLSDFYFSQRLIERQSEIDEYLRASLDRGLSVGAEDKPVTRTDETVGTGASELKGGIAAFLSLRAVFYYSASARLSIFSSPPFRKAFRADYDEAIPVLPFAPLETILKLAQAQVRSWGGTLKIVTIADAQMYDSRDSAKITVYRRLLSEVLKRAGLEEISVFEDLSLTPSPYAFYAPIGPYYGHFNREGYTRLAGRLKNGY